MRPIIKFGFCVEPWHCVCEQNLDLHSINEFSNDFVFNSFPLRFVDGLQLVDWSIGLTFHNSPDFICKSGLPRPRTIVHVDSYFAANLASPATNTIQSDEYCKIARLNDSMGRYGDNN